MIGNEFSVLMSIYHKENPRYFRSCMESIFNQTEVPDELVLVKDGPLTPELDSVISEYRDKYSILTVVELPKNVGLGQALQEGLKYCKYDLVARMDSDDICVPDRFELQLNFMNNNPDICVSGGQILEFENDIHNIIGKREVPLLPEDCRKYYRNRDPLNHMTVIFRKKNILDVGGYLPWHLDEDSFLWGRLLVKGYKIANLPNVLVYVRGGKEMYGRRGGWKYFKSDTKLLKWKLNHKLITYSGYAYNYTIRFIVQVLFPNWLRGFIYEKFLRK